MFALGDPGALEGLYRGPVFRTYPFMPLRYRGVSLRSGAVENMRKGAGDLKELMNRVERG